MSKESTQSASMLYWADYLDESETTARHEHKPGLNTRMLSYAIGLSSLFWSVLLIASHILL